MANKCAVTNCTSGYTKGFKKPSFHFLEGVELKKSIFILLIKKKGHQLQIQLSM